MDKKEYNKIMKDNKKMYNKMYSNPLEKLNKIIFYSVVTATLFFIIKYAI